MNAEHLAQAGWRRARQGQPEIGAWLLEDAATALPERADIAGACGIAFARALQPRKAVEWLKKSLALDGASVDLWCALAEAALALSNYTEAHAAFAQCLKLDPTASHPAGVRARGLIKRTEKQLIAMGG